MTISTVTSQGQITIPAQVRATLGLKQGDRVKLVELEGGQYVMVAATQPVQRLKGMIRKPKAAVSIDAMNVAVARRSRS